MLGLVAAGSLGLSACGSSSSPTPDSLTAPPHIQTRAELGCVGIAGPLDVLQIPLSNTLVSGLQSLPDTVAVAGELATLVVDTLDLVDSIAQAAGTLSPDSTNPDAALLSPVLDQTLCTVAAVGEVLLELSLDVTTPLADRVALNGLLNSIVALQSTLQTALGQIAAGGSVPAAALVLQQVTNTLGGIVASPLGLTTLPGGEALGTVLQPVSFLLLEVSSSLSALADGNATLFVDDLLGAVSHLVESLAANLGPLGVALTPVVNLLVPVLTLVDNLLTAVLDILV